MKYFVHCVNALSHFLLLAVFGIKYKVNLLFSLLVHQMASTECHQDERRCFTAFFFFFLKSCLHGFLYPPRGYGLSELHDSSGPLQASASRTARTSSQRPLISLRLLGEDNPRRNRNLERTKKKINLRRNMCLYWNESVCWLICNKIRTGLQLSAIVATGARI